jgi:hypothetical protein
LKQFQTNSEIVSKDVVAAGSDSPAEVLPGPTVKRTITVKDVVSLDPARLIYPRGIVSKVRESQQDCPPLKRIELFATTDDNDTYGVLRSIFVAFSAERRLLEVAQASNGVIRVTSINGGAGTASRGSERQKIVGDTLILKRMEGEERQEEMPGLPFRRVRIPDLHVPARWREMMNLKPGDRLIVSNPIESYEVPPPNV